MRVLITGANGMLGEKCVRLLSPGHDVYTIDLADALLYPAKASYEKLDITDASATKSYLQHNEPEVIINCAAFTDVDGCELQREKAWLVNVKGVAHLISAFQSFGRHFIHISTDYVFNGQNGPYSEDDPVCPINYYGETKLASEGLCARFKGLVTILRTNVLFGSAASPQACFVHWVRNKLEKRESIRVVNDQFGNPTWADSLAEAIQLIVTHQTGGVYHFGGRDFLNRFEFALQIAAVFNLDPTLIRSITTSALGQRARRPYRSGLITTKIQHDLPVKICSIREALMAMKGNQV